MDTSSCLGQIRESFTYWSAFLANPRYCQSGTDVAWYDFKEPHFSAILDSEELAKAAETGQYTFQLADDGSLFRMLYAFDARGRVLRHASLSFLSAPSPSVFCEIRDAMGTTRYLPHCSWLRVDFDPQSAGGIQHAACHMHISSMPESRIPLARVPSPKQFVAWVLSLVRQESFAQMVERNEHHAVNAPCFTDEWHGDLRSFLYLSVPPVP